MINDIYHREAGCDISLLADLLTQRFGHATAFLSYNKQEIKVHC